MSVAPWEDDDTAVGIELRLVPDASAPAVARRAIERNRGLVDDACLEDTALLLSELVTNSVCHAALDPAEAIEVNARLSAGGVRVEVLDRGRGFPSRRRASGGGGWGLVLVERLAHGWGIDRRNGETLVWFEVRPCGAPDRARSVRFV